MNEVLSMENVVVKRKGQSQVLDIETFQVNRGELVAIVGPNGAGKSTLLRVINLLQSHQGKVRLFGEAVNKRNQTMLRRRATMVFQDTFLLEGSVYDNISWPLRFREVPTEQIKKQVHKIMTDFGCAHLGHRPAKQLSGGEMQRVCISRALVTAPELILLDEPFASLDVMVRMTMLEELRSVAKREGMTVLMVSHNYSEVLRFADRVVALFDGKIIQDGTPNELMRHPKDERIARLVGIDNILPCSIVEGKEQEYVMLLGKVCIPMCKLAKKHPAYCCLPGDALLFGNEQREQKNGYWIQLNGVIDRVVPGMGMCCVLFKVENTLLTASLPRTQMVEDLHAGDQAVFSFNLEEAQFV